MPAFEFGMLSFQCEPFLCLRSSEDIFCPQTDLMEYHFSQWNRLQNYFTIVPRSASAPARSLGHPEIDELSRAKLKRSPALRNTHSPIVLDHLRALPQRNDRPGPAFAGSLIGCHRQLRVLDARQVLDDLIAVDSPHVDAVQKVGSGQRRTGGLQATGQTMRGDCPTGLVTAFSSFGQRQGAIPALPRRASVRPPSGRSI
jgi:hypothetical protein